jgi:hypothetical protein
VAVKGTRAISRVSYEIERGFFLGKREASFVVPRYTVREGGLLIYERFLRHTF